MNCFPCPSLILLLSPNFSRASRLLLRIRFGQLISILTAQTYSCQVTFLTSDSPCTGLTGAKFKEGVKQCVRKGSCTHHRPSPHAAAQRPQTCAA